VLLAEERETRRTRSDWVPASRFYRARSQRMRSRHKGHLVRTVCKR